MPRKFREISLVLPCFNEEKNIESTVLNAQKYLERNFELFEILAVNDGSTDQTLEKLQKMKEEGRPFLKIISRRVNKGKGWAVKEGVLRSQYALVMFMDADQAIPIEELNHYRLKAKDLVALKCL